jgi:S-adenosylmethionine decarboxylase
MGGKMNYTTIGKHATVDFWGVSFARLNDRDQLMAQLQQALKQTQVQILSCQAHQFQPHGVTVVAMLAESHASIHTYPESGFAALDCYTCGEQLDPLQVIDCMATYLKPERIHQRLLRRGDGAIEFIPTPEKMESGDR